MKRNHLVLLPCILGMLFLYNCSGEPPQPLPIDVTIEGDLVVAEDFYLRNKPEPVDVDYSVMVVSQSQSGCEMTIDISLDLYRFDAITQEFVFEKTLDEATGEEVVCDTLYEGSPSWSYDQKASATTYKIILEITMDGTGYSVASDLFVIWKSSGAPKGHAKRDFKKIDQAEKLITKLEAYHAVYEALKAEGLITGDELVDIHEQIMTVDEAVAMADAHMQQAIEENAEAISYLESQDYETSFIKAKIAAREAHSALNIYHALLAQATHGSE
jgi:hypothetical protein